MITVVQVDIAKNAFHQEASIDDEDEEEGKDASPKDVGHNIYILATQVSYIGKTQHLHTGYTGKFVVRHNILHHDYTGQNHAGFNS